MIEYLEKWCCMLIFINNNEDSKADDNANEKNQRLVDHAMQITDTLPCTKYVFYNGMINEADNWQGKVQKFVIAGNDKVIQRMNAFEFAFKQGFRKVILIENDTTELQTKHLLEAFNSLKLIEFCIGPKKFGGYYMLGMNYYEPALFTNLRFDSPALLKDCIKEIGKVKKALYKLPVLAEKVTEKKLHTHY